jgi:hypothetical protein
MLHAQEMTQHKKKQAQKQFPKTRTTNKALSTPEIITHTHTNDKSETLWQNHLRDPIPKKTLLQCSTARESAIASCRTQGTKSACPRCVDINEMKDTKRAICSKVKRNRHVTDNRGGVHLCATSELPTFQTLIIYIRDKTHLLMLRQDHDEF